jgi:hypothetical protein
MLLILVSAFSASAETLMMPDRSFLIAPVSEVVWGTTTLPVGSTYVFHFGDGTPDTAAAPVADGSYIAINHAFATAGTFTASLTVTSGAIVEVAHVTLQVFDPAPLAADQLRNLNVNRAIQDGLRYFWFSQLNRTANFPNGTMTSWPDTVFGNTRFAAVQASLVTAAFQNQGYFLTNDQVAPTGVYQKYIVLRALNFIASQLSSFTTGLTGAAGNNPCVGVDTNGNPIGPGTPVGQCTGFELLFDEGYATPIAMQALAGSGALKRLFPAAGVGVANGMSYGEVLQRLAIGDSWGQGDSADAGGRGGWIYNFKGTQVDGSTMGWQMVGLLDTAAAGIVIPGFVKTEFVNFAFPFGMNTDGSYDYRADGNQAVFNNPNVAKAGVALQMEFYSGDNTFLAASKAFITARWSGTPLAGDAFGCGAPATPENLGCSYMMYNVFKGLKLQGVTTLPGIGRPAGPGAILADDWYAAYVDFLVANQDSQTSQTGGQWFNHMSWSCCSIGQNNWMNSAIAELILAPTALVPPDPGLFSTIGLSPPSAVNPIGSNHTVTALAQTASMTPVPGVTITFEVLSGPNAGASGSGVTNASGQTTFTYADTKGAGIDTIQAFIGALGSNQVTKKWGVACDVNLDGMVNMADLLQIRANFGPVTPANAINDTNGDGTINMTDVRLCQMYIFNLANPAPGD